MGRLGNSYKKIRKIIFHPFDSKEPIIYELSEEGKIKKKMKRAVRTNYRGMEKKQNGLLMKKQIYIDITEVKIPIFTEISNEIENNENIISNNHRVLLVIGGDLKLDVINDIEDYGQIFSNEDPSK
ncbi:hypothetical protein M9Y10_009106 [Tritrichomonas musculus]|uniref:Uncharacterized protein n=1 Tax=Tritrichomonas musculus TaxID=1915356 RepID=A0ABR2J130_9EUKA